MGTSGENWRALRARMREYQADPEALLAWLIEFRERCKAGIETERNTARGDIVPVVETLPKLELEATVQIFNIYKYVVGKAEAQEEGTQEAQVIQISITPARDIPEDLRPDDE